MSALAEELPSRQSDPPDVIMRKRLVTAGCMLAIFMAAVEATIVATAMPTIVADLGGAHLFSWVFSAYLLTQAVTTPLYGRLADIYGRKLVFIAGSSLFLVSSAACGFTWNMASLVIFRVIQGLGAGSVQSVATTIVGDIYSPTERARMQGWLSGVWVLAAVIGPSLGAATVQYLNWAYVFWVNLPVGAIAMALIGVFLAEEPQPRRHDIDYLGAILLMLGLGAIMTVLVQAQSLGWTLAASLGATGVAAIAWLTAHERRTKEPIIPIALLRNRTIAAGTFGSLIVGALLMCVVAFLPTYVQAVMGRSAAVAGSVLTGLSLAWSCGSMSAGRLMVRTSARLSGTVGALALIAGATMLITLEFGGGLLWMTAGCLLVGIGMGFCHIVFLLVVQASVGWSERGIATASTLFARTLGQAIGAGLGGAILNYGIASRAPDTGDVLGRLIEPGLRQALGADQIARLVEAVATSLHDIYVVGGVLALVALATALLLPAGAGRAPSPKAN